MIDTPPRTPQSPDVEIVQETQAPQDEPRRKRAHKKKAPDEPRMKTTKIPWTPEEEMNLCKAWLDITEDPQEGIKIILLNSVF